MFNVEDWLNEINEKLGLDAQTALDIARGSFDDIEELIFDLDADDKEALKLNLHTLHGAVSTLQLGELSSLVKDLSDEVHSNEDISIDLTSVKGSYEDFKSKILSKN